MMTLLPLKLSSKFKFATKVSLSIVLAYLIPMSMGWNQPSTAAMTIMVIASANGVHESISKGMIRIVGTVIGAAVGLALIALFPQERLLYLLSLSLILAFIIYLYYAYQGDSSVFLLSAMVIMMIFVQGVDNAFLYGMDRTFMTLFGILLYTLVNIFLWPEKQNNMLNAVNKKEPSAAFIFLDFEYIKATLQLLFIFWISVAFWIYFNPPGGFLLVTLATILGLYTTFTPLKPTVLMALLSFGFVFATLAYTFILPNLVQEWQLALFIFFYSFIAFYILNPQITIFFLLGMFLLNISNTMNYNFALFLNILLVFYLFLTILILMHNFPFSSKPEYLFLKAKELYFEHMQKALIKRRKRDQHFINLALKKMEFWMPHIDYNYFKETTKEELTQFVKECKILAQKLQEENAILPNIEQELQALQEAQNTRVFATLKMSRF